MPLFQKGGAMTGKTLFCPVIRKMAEPFPGTGQPHSIRNFIKHQPGSL
jgi:hypothetical protein